MNTCDICGKSSHDVVEIKNDFYVMSVCLNCLAEAENDKNIV